MKIRNIHIDGFGKFENRDIDFSDGVNIIYGANEAGKTTIHNFLEAMLYGTEKKGHGFTKSMQDAMRPWKEGVPYGGTMCIEHKGNRYLIRRDFSKPDAAPEITDLSNGEKIKEPEKFLSVVLGGVTRGAFKSSVSIDQLSSRTGTALVNELKSYVGNIGSTGDPDLNAGKAVELLRKRKAELEEQIEEGASKNYAASLSRIKTIDKEIDVPENENCISECEAAREQIRAEIEGKEKDFLSAVDRVAAETGILKGSGIESQKDVEQWDLTAQQLSDRYASALAGKKSPWRVVGMVLCVLAMAAAVYGYLTGFLSLVVYAYAGIFAAAFILLILLVVRTVNVSHNFRDAERELSGLLRQRVGEEEISRGTIERLFMANHSLDGVLADREKDRSLKDDLEADLAALRQKHLKAQEDVEAQQKIRFSVEEKLSEQNGLRDRAERLRLAVAENNRLKEEIDAIDIAMDTIRDLSDSIRGRLGTYLNEEASRALRKVTNGKYRSMDVGSGNDVFLSTKDGMVSVNDVSAGTLDQVYLAVRLAAARFIMGGGDRLPVIFDDSFALYDDHRLKEAICFVAEDYSGQSLFFTCHHREEKAVSDIDHRLIEL